MPQNGPSLVIRNGFADLRCPRTLRILLRFILAMSRGSRRNREWTVVLVGAEWVILHRPRKFRELQETILLAAVGPWYKLMALMDCSLLHGVRGIIESSGAFRSWRLSTRGAFNGLNILLFNVVRWSRAVIKRQIRKRGRRAPITTSPAQFPSVGWLRGALLLYPVSSRSSAGSLDTLHGAVLHIVLRKRYSLPALVDVALLLVIDPVMLVTSLVKFPLRKDHLNARMPGSQAPMLCFKWVRPQLGGMRLKIRSWP